MLAAFLGPFCLDFQKINKISDYVPPIYRDTKAGLILSVQLGSTLCMSYSNGEYAREYVNGKIEQLTQTVCNSFNFFIYLQVILRIKLQLRSAQVQVALQEPF